MAFTQQQLQDIMQAALTAVQQPNNDTRPRVKAPERPDMDLGCSETTWAFFEDEWKLYKRRAALNAGQAKDELRACCSKELRKTLFDFIGASTIEGYTEEQLLEKIKETAVIGKNKAVHRKEFYEIIQAPDEQLKLFVAKLKAKAERCNFTMECTAAGCTEVLNYGEQMIKDQMTTGLYDKDVQQEVLAKDKTLTTLELVYNHVEAYEQGKRAKSELQGPSEVNAVQSQYKKSKSSGENDETSRACNGCGGPAHGGYMQREKDCPAWGQKCYGCGKKNHFKRNCKTPKKSNGSANDTVNAANLEDKSEIPSEVAAMGGANVSYFYAFSNELNLQQRDGKVVAVPHIEWDGEKFCKAAPPPLPMLEVSIVPLITFHAKFTNSEINVVPVTVKAKAFTDTCAQTCVAGRDLMVKFRLNKGMLIETSHQIKGVTNEALNILGILLVEISFKGAKTYGVIYVCDNVNGIFLSENVQKRLGIISKSYPNVSNACSNSVIVTETKKDASMAKCGCPKRVDPPPPPEQIPFEATKENRQKLQEWILSTYASSAFNTCDHQPIKTLSGKPLEIHFREDVHPVARHSPVPIPVHLKEEVKKLLDRDEQIQVCERVPSGVPSVWLSPMLVTLKKSGKVRRVVDYQAVNKATLRETHHTPTPFQLASSIPPNMVKTLLDAWNGYHALPLTEKASNALMFITEWGRYRPLTAPQGFHGSGDGYTKRTDDIIMGFPRKRKCVDDSLLHDSSIEKAFWHTIDYVILCNKNGIIFVGEKFIFAAEELDFAGFTVTMDGVKPTEQMIKSLEGFPVPKNRTDLKSFFGLVQFVSYVFSKSKQLAPFRDLLKKSSEWYWDNSLNEIFSKCKKVIVDEVVNGVKTFQVNLPCALWTD